MNLAHMALSVGAHLGSYEILGLLGSGGMGEVYRARDTKLGRTVAIKVILDQFASDEERVGRFQREVEMSTDGRARRPCSPREFGAVLVRTAN